MQQHASAHTHLKTKQGRALELAAARAGVEFVPDLVNLDDEEVALIEHALQEGTLDALKPAVEAAEIRFTRNRNKMKAELLDFLEWVVTSAARRARTRERVNELLAQQSRYGLGPDNSPCPKCLSHDTQLRADRRELRCLKCRDRFPRWSA